MKVCILRGVSGSGKSTLANQAHSADPELFVKVSTDDYFTSSDGTYHFDPSKLDEAHANCLMRFLGILAQCVCRLASPPQRPPISQSEDSLLMYTGQQRSRSFFALDSRIGQSNLRSIMQPFNSQ